ncbi:MAG: biopolymer transporter ExbD [Bacteroidetes bacterium]|nr:biopolymer transporter ExbD [Bacteroidota bacterium]
MAIRKRSKVTTEFSLSAMTDIIFMLLIFFILTSTVSTDPVLKILLPKGVKDKDVTAKKPINLYLNEKGEYAINTSGNILFSDLPSALEMELSKDPLVPVSIHADKNVSYEKVMEMVSMANKKGAKVVLALEKEPTTAP